jgi:hypothetical protein
MTVQNSVAVRDAQNDIFETTVGASPSLDIRTGVQPANCAAANAGTLLATGVLPADFLTASSAGTKSKNGVWTATGQPAAGAGTAAGHYRIMQGATCHEQGSVSGLTSIPTSALTAANSNVLNFAATAGVAVGQNAVGTGIPVNTTVLAFTGTTVTLSNATVTGVASGATVAFAGDMVVDNNNIATAQVVTITAYNKTRNNA